MSRSKTALFDSDPMPFGQYRGTKMQEIPVSYFHWMWYAGKKDDKHCPVHQYIKRNITAFQMENADLIWD